MGRYCWVNKSFKPTFGPLAGPKSVGGCASQGGRFGLRRSRGWRRQVALVFTKRPGLQLSIIGMAEWQRDRLYLSERNAQRQRQTMQSSRPWETCAALVLDECLWQRYDCICCLTTGLFSKACFPSSSTQLYESRGISVCFNDNQSSALIITSFIERSGSFFPALIRFCLFSVPSCRWEAVQVHVGQLRLAFRPFRRADASLPEAHGRQTLPVRRLLALLFPLRPPRPAHEETPELAAFAPTHTHYKHTSTIFHTHTHIKHPQCYKLPDDDTTAAPGAAIMCR